MERIIVNIAPEHRLLIDELKAEGYSVSAWIREAMTRRAIMDGRWADPTPGSAPRSSRRRADAARNGKARSSLAAAP